ncbi:tetratricopeptide repeat protein [Phaeobacter sp.]|uniref:tetratricopeptide repeat protein n=1 Tax=Phaeobacter sp. TaxID=1902409 RepID=UPI0025F962D3|nr:tetratricopeptide repeat protein [Phaeobacter sp.]
MVVKCTKLKAIVAATSLTGLIWTAAPVFSQSGTEPDELLAALAEADREEAIALDRSLQAIWDKSGSAAMDFLLKRGRDAMERGETKAAVEHFTALTDHAPDFARGWYERARAYFVSGLYGPAVADLERTLALNPNDYNALYALGTLFERFNDPDRAYRAYLLAQAIHPHHDKITSALDRLKDTVSGKEL